MTNRLLNFSDFMKNEYTNESNSEDNDFKENIKIDKNVNIKESYNMCMNLFTESLNAIDAIAALTLAVDPNSSNVVNYRKNRWRLLDRTFEGKSDILEIWDKIDNITDNMLKEVINYINTEQKIEEYKKDKYKLDKEVKSSKVEIKKDYYDKELKRLKQKYESSTDPIQIILITNMIESIKLYKKAVNNFKNGIKIEFKYADEKINNENYYDIVGNGIINIIRSKKLKIGLNENIDLFESLKGTLNQNEPFVNGVFQGLKDVFIKTKENDPDIDRNIVLNNIENLRSQLLIASSDIDNIINYKKNAGGDPSESVRSAEKAKNSISEVIDFIRVSYEYLINTKENLDKSNDIPIRPISNKIKEISEKLLIYRRKDGILDKWKNDILGTVEIDGQSINSRVESQKYLQVGKKLMAKASMINDKNLKYAISKNKIEEFDVDRHVQKAMGYAKDEIYGEDRNLIDNIKSGNRSFSINNIENEKENKEILKDFQDRLIDIGELPKGVTKGEYDEMTRSAVKRSMIFIGALSGKVYEESDVSLKDYQKDFLIYQASKEKIKKILDF